MSAGGLYGADTNVLVVDCFNWVTERVGHWSPDEHGYDMKRKKTKLFYTQGASLQTVMALCKNHCFIAEYCLNGHCHLEAVLGCNNFFLGEVESSV